MSVIVPISMIRESADDRVAAHRIRTMPVLVISPHNQCNCRCVMCDIWRIREPREITPTLLERQLASFRELGVRWVVFTGGEPQLNAQMIFLAQMLRAEGIRITLLTAGLLLESHAESIAANVDDVIISLDGPPAVHDQIRRVAHAFEQIKTGVAALRRFRPDMMVRARCTVQKANHGSLCGVVKSAKEIGLNSISFLAADLTSDAFNRPQGWVPERQNRIALNAEEVDALEAEVERLVIEHRPDLDSGYVVESAGKLRRIVLHFRAHLGQAQHVAPNCNAPWVSSVIEASGEVRPCFFHPSLGNIHEQTLRQIVNSPQALRFRATLDVATNPVCRRCVCSLHIPRHED
ncbi:MAG TPA: radical SAM protein [Candidatus Acidoferrales bacterium]|nr:radical SAM protein [Candidatus Acidoferrales bacterium]